MTNTHTELQEQFRLRPLKAAKVSEISETTAASPVPPEERVNFHIGHPVRDPDLIAHYQKLALGLPGDPGRISGSELSKLIPDTPWEEDDLPQLQLSARAIERSVPYMPRGGFASHSPSKLAALVRTWLIDHQQDPLEYDLGEETGSKELIFASGGTYEFLRIFFHTLSVALIHTPSKILLYGLEKPVGTGKHDSLRIRNIGGADTSLQELLLQEVHSEPETPVFLLTGEILSETDRRELRRLSQEHPVFFLEINNAPNHLSLGREAGLYNRVLRILTPEAIDPAFRNLPITMVLGNPEYLKALETIHFQLKGNPPAADTELFTYLLERKLNGDLFSDEEVEREPTPDDSRLKLNDFGAGLGISGSSIQHLLQQTEQNLSERVSLIQKRVEQIGGRAAALEKHPPTPHRIRTGTEDPLAGMDRQEILRSFFNKYPDREWLETLEEAFLQVFLDHHPGYERNSCTVVSGSSRTALSLLGYSCGIEEVVVPDLSWTYEHCFHRVEAVGLAEGQRLDADALINRIREKLEQDISWKDRGAVVLNNPHNASGRIFDEKEIEKLIRWLLQQGVYVIDDLAYENVIPHSHLNGPKTCRQIANQLAKRGRIRRTQVSRLITVHSLSKTDCFAGSRLAVAEISEPDLDRRFREYNSRITSNWMALLLAYLFYRNDIAKVREFWQHRNAVFEQRMAALSDALDDLAGERNPFRIAIHAPEGAMYPQLNITNLPPGISLDWLSSGLATRGIGLVPLSTFARTSPGYRLARQAFRLTLGGGDDAKSLYRKTRRVLIDLNRLITEESARYNREIPGTVGGNAGLPAFLKNASPRWDKMVDTLRNHAENHLLRLKREQQIFVNPERTSETFLNEYLPERIRFMEIRFKDRLSVTGDTLQASTGDHREKVMGILDRELSPETLSERNERFRHRLFDRTVHPTQMYSLKVERRVDGLIRQIIFDKPIRNKDVDRLALEIIREYYGRNILIRSIDETDELNTDLQVMIDSELWSDWRQESSHPVLLSFWGDWDGSTRPSGQGHRLAAAAVSENVNRLSNLIRILLEHEVPIDIPDELLDEINRLDDTEREFWELLNTITRLTNQLENRYQRVLPFGVEPSPLRKLGMKLGIARDPVAALWQHNDRLERRMLKLRSERREQLLNYFRLNRDLQHTVSENLEAISDALHLPEVALHTGLYRNLLKRFALTPRIHQKMILSQDQFAIDTTVYNIMEINEIAGRYEVPGLVEALQVSMSTDPEAFISLERKLRSRREEVLRESGDIPLPSIWVVPLFEGVETVKNLENYLDRVWEYAAQSRPIEQSEVDRFSEMVCELFVAGSDLSQQVSQSAGEGLYREAKHRAIRWLAKRGLAGDVRIKLGSGEPMQRQGGYYDPHAGKAVIRATQTASVRLDTNVSDAAREGVAYARSPLRGVWSSGDFRTFQSNIFEHLRQIPAKERAELFYHISRVQETYEQELSRAGEPLLDTRLSYERQGYQELEMLTLGRKDELYEEFVDHVTENFRQILYGREEDVVGIHVISYFIARTSPPLRDRPVVRPSRESGEERGQQIVERIARILPLRHHGSLLRAIGHNRSQSMVLGVNQLTTGLFRALRRFAETHSGKGDTTALIRDRIMPRLPVQDILHTLRIYQDLDLKWIREMENIFPANNSALFALREDTESIPLFTGLFQRELLRRHGLNPDEFFGSEHIKGDLLPVLRPDLAVLLQPDLFNTREETLLRYTGEIRDDQWLQEMRNLLQIPVEVAGHREHIWDLIQEPIQQQVNSFNELALAISRISADEQAADLPFSTETEQVSKLGSQVADMLRGAVDDSMRQFLIAVVQYLTRLPETTSEVPIDVLRALRDIERIIKIEEQPLSSDEQNKLRYYLLQIARLARENG